MIAALSRPGIIDPLKKLFVLVKDETTLFAKIASSNSTRLEKPGFFEILKKLLLFVNDDMDKFVRIASCNSAMARLEKPGFFKKLTELLALVDNDMETFVRVCNNGIAPRLMDDGYIGALWEVLDYQGGDLMVFRNLLNGSVVLLIWYNRHLHLARHRLNTRVQCSIQSTAVQLYQACSELEFIESLLHGDCTAEDGQS